MTGPVDKWNAKYRQAERDGALPDPQPLPALTAYASLFPHEGHALDLACGRAANAEWMAQRGLVASAWDCSDVVIAQVADRFACRGLDVDAQVRDVSAQPPAAESFDLIVVSHFLDRTLAEPITAALRPGGWLVYQTFSRDHVGSAGPSNPDFRLKEGELLGLFSRLSPRIFFDLGGRGDGQVGLRDESLLIAQKSS